jgi:hypothetical protein
MAAVEATGTGQGTLVGAEKAKLRKVLGRFDLVLFTACAIVGLDTIAAAAQGYLHPEFPCSRTGAGRASK